MEIINGRQHGFIGKNKIYIGRRSIIHHLPESALHNPYLIDFNCDRKKACKLFDIYLWEKVKRWAETGEMDEAMILLRDICLALHADEEIILTCYCMPLQCHGSGIMRCAKWIIQQEWFLNCYP
jgi:hypothetical protein